MLFRSDGTWFHERGSNYVDWDFYSNNLHRYGTADYKPESVIVVFFKATAYPNSLVTINVDYLDVSYVINNETAPKNESIWSTPSTDFFVNFGYIDTTDTSIHMLWAMGSTSGPLNSRIFSSGATSTSVQLLPDIAVQQSAEWYDFFATGDYRILAYGNDAANSTYYKVISNTGVILDTLTIAGNAYEQNIRCSKKSIFVRT